VEKIMYTVPDQVGQLVVVTALPIGAGSER
jgi:hypothetical protein